MVPDYVIELKSIGIKIIEDELIYIPGQFLHNECINSKHPTIIKVIDNKSKYGDTCFTAKVIKSKDRLYSIGKTSDSFIKGTWIPYKKTIFEKLFGIK